MEVLVLLQRQQLFLEVFTAIMVLVLHILQQEQLRLRLYPLLMHEVMRYVIIRSQLERLILLLILLMFYHDMVQLLGNMHQESIVLLPLVLHLLGQHELFLVAQEHIFLGWMEHLIQQLLQVLH